MKIQKLEDLWRELINRARNMTRPLVVGLAGGECVGKSYLARALTSMEPGSLDVATIPLDAYLAVSRAQRRNFDEYSEDISIRAKRIGDHPELFNLVQLRDDLQSLLAHGSLCNRRRYDYDKGEVITEPTTLAVSGNSIVILEGLFALHDTLVDELDVAIFVCANESIVRQRYLVRHKERRTGSAERIIDIFERMVLPAYHTLVERFARNADYIVHNNDDPPTATKLAFGRELLRMPKLELPSPGPGRYKVFVSRNFDDTALLILECVRKAASQASIELIESRPGGSAMSPAKDVRSKLEHVEAMLAIVRTDTNWISNEIGMAYALHLPVSVIHDPSANISGIAQMITSVRPADITNPTALGEACELAFAGLKRQIEHQRAKLPEAVGPGSTITRIGWWHYYDLLRLAYREIETRDLNPHSGGYAPTIVLGISRGGIVAADIFSRLGGDRHIGILEAKRRTQAGEVYFDEEPLRTLLRIHCNENAGEIRILVVEDVMRSGTSLMKAMNTVERVVAMFDPHSILRISIRSLVLISHGEPTRKPYQPNYVIRKVPEDASIVLPYGCG